MSVKDSQRQTGELIHLAAREAWLFAAILILCALTALDALGQTSQQDCLEKFKNCSECQLDTFQGRNLTGVTVTNGGCVATDNYGRKATDAGASDNLKACQRCLGSVGTPQDTKHVPIIFLPGVAGSMLSSGNSEVWPLAPVGDRADLALEPDGVTSATRANIVVGDVLRRSPKMNFYGSFIEFLKSLDYKDSIDLYLLPYDWRLSNDAHYNRLDQLIQTALSSSGKQKVILIAHSMGGVIARGYVYSSPERAAKVESFITMGTPYWGAPKVYYGVVNGYQFGNDTVRQPLMKILMQNYLAGYQLLPQIPFINDTASNRTLSQDEANSIRYKWFTRVHYSFIDQYDSTTGNECFFNPTLLGQAKQFYSAVGTKDNPKPLPGGVKQYVIIGTGVSTLGSYNLEDWKPGALPIWPFTGTYLEIGQNCGVNCRKVVLRPRSEDGDGTVALWGLETAAATSTYYVPYVSGFISDESTGHADLPANKTVQSIVAQILKNAPPDPNQYPKPQQYMGIPITPGKELESLASFELHSDAHLRISHSSGKTLGFTNEGLIDESLPGTFLSMDDSEYASFADINVPLQVSVTGIRDGKFTLDVNIKRAGSSATQFSYREVPVRKGTVAQVTLTPSQVSAPPPLLVTTDGMTTTIPASSSAGGAVAPQGGAGGTPQPVPVRPWPPSSGGIGGTWTAPTGEVIELIQNGNRITGRYRGILGTGEITGTFDGKNLSATVRPNQGLLPLAIPLSLTLMEDGKLLGRLETPLLSSSLVFSRSRR